MKSRLSDDPARKRRLALVCQHFYPELVSTGLHMTELAEQLVKRDWSVDVICAPPTFNSPEASEESDRGRTFEYRGITVRRVPALGSHGAGVFRRLLFAATYSLLGLFEVLRRFRELDILLVTTNPPFVGLVGLVASRLAGMPYLVVCYDVYPDFAAELGVVRRGGLVERTWSRLTQMIFEKAEAVVTIGADMRKIVEGTIAPGARVEVIHNWANEDKLLPVPPGENDYRQHYGLEGCFVVGYAGNMGRTHPMEVLLEAAVELQDEDEIQFLLVGGGAKREKVEEAVAEHDLTNVILLPFQPRERLSEVLSAADVGVVGLESPWTGLSVPSKTYGVMAVGTPVLGLLDEKSEIGKTIARHRCGIVIEDPTGRQVAEVIRELSRQRDRCQRMGERAREAFLEGYTLDRAGRKYSRLLSDVVS